MENYNDKRYAYGYERTVPLLDADSYSAELDAYSQYEKEYDNPIELPIRGVRLG